MDYSKYGKKAKSKINQYGGTCSIIRKGSETYNAETNEYTSTDVTINGKAVCSVYDEKYTNGTSILAGDVNLSATFDESPVVGDTISFGGKKYNVVSVSPINPDGNCVIYYDIQAR